MKGLDAEYIILKSYKRLNANCNVHPFNPVNPV